MRKNQIFFINIIFFSIMFSQEAWFNGNLEGVEELNLKLNIRGLEDDIWEKKLKNFIKLRFLEHDLQIADEPMPQLVVDIHLIDSRIDKVSSYLVLFSLYSYSISEYDYYQSLVDSSIPKHLMISKIFSQEVMGQSDSGKLYKDVEKNINKLISILIDQWYKDNPMKQF